MDSPLGHEHLVLLAGREVICRKVILRKIIGLQLCTRAKAFVSFLLCFVTSILTVCYGASIIKNSFVKFSKCLMSQWDARHHCALKFELEGQLSISSNLQSLGLQIAARFFKICRKPSNLLRNRWSAFGEP
jgi:hypothetical protein